MEEERENFLDILRQLRLHQCAYSMDKQASMCDCKFHRGNTKLTWKTETSNACPELLWVIRHIEGMTDKQFAKFRTGKQSPQKIRR